jgi:serine phosphatase RsbU (regulator of sigma subunit)
MVLDPHRADSGHDASGPGKRELHRVVLDDLRTGRIGRDALRDIKSLYAFYLEEERRVELAAMGRVRRVLSMLLWIFKSLLLKLSPTRRILLVAAFGCALFGYKRFVFQGVDFSANLYPVAFTLVLLVLMLELRDKLLVRDEIEVAREVQLALLPRRHPHVPGWAVWSYTRPANDVGGDLVDYLDLDGFRHGVVVADVAGKGLGAALLTAKLQATLRALLPREASLDDLGARLNHVLHRDGIENRYATMFLLELEHDSGEARYLNAGHNPPLLLRGESMERLHASSYPLGMLPSASYREGTLRLAPGDLILVYSDGLTEALNEAGEEFGVARIEAALRAAAGGDPATVGGRILEEVRRFQGPVRPTDDLSLAVVVRSPATGQEAAQRS